MYKQKSQPPKGLAKMNYKLRKLDFLQLNIKPISAKT